MLNFSRAQLKPMSHHSSPSSFRSARHLSVTMSLLPIATEIFMFYRMAPWSVPWKCRLSLTQCVLDILSTVQKQGPRCLHTLHRLVRQLQIIVFKLRSGWKTVGFTFWITLTWHCTQTQSYHWPKWWHARFWTEVTMWTWYCAVVISTRYWSTTRGICCRKWGHVIGWTLFQLHLARFKMNTMSILVL